MAARELAALHAKDGGGVALLMVVKGAPANGGAESVAGFAQAAGPNARLLCDAAMDVFRAIGQKEPLRIGALLSATSARRSRNALKEMKTQTTAGEGFVAGGGLMLDREGNVTFAWQERKGLGDRPPDPVMSSELRAIARGEGPPPRLQLAGAAEAVAR